MEYVENFENCDQKIVNISVNIERRVLGVVLNERREDFTLKMNLFCFPTVTGFIQGFKNLYSIYTTNVHHYTNKDHMHKSHTHTQHIQKYIK